jgi:hypothetical protein
MKFKKVNLKDGGVYNIANDDKCFVIKQGESKIWISKELIDYLAEKSVVLETKIT